MQDKVINVFTAPGSYRNFMAFAEQNPEIIEHQSRKIRIRYAKINNTYSPVLGLLKKGELSPDKSTCIILDHTEFVFGAMPFGVGKGPNGENMGFITQPTFNKIGQYSRLLWRGVTSANFPLMRDLPVTEINGGTSLENGKKYVARLLASSMTRGMFTFEAQRGTSINGVVNAIHDRIRNQLSVEAALERAKKYGVELYPGFFEPKNLPTVGAAGSYIITEYQPDIVGEYRFFTDVFGSVNLIMRRERCESNGGTMNTPINGVDVLMTLDDFIQETGQAIYDEISTAIQRTRIPLAGFDIFVTEAKDEKKANWGIFEFSPGYGMGELPHSYARETYLGGIVKVAEMVEAMSDSVDNQ